MKASSGDVEMWNKLISFAQARFSAEDLRSFLLCCYGSDENCLHLAAYNDFDESMIEAICGTIKDVFSVEGQKKNMSSN